MELGECRPYAARISPRQCEVNRQRGKMYFCWKCLGLEDVKEFNVEVGMSSKTGKCVKCGRPNMTIVAAGLCGKCYQNRKKEKAGINGKADESLPDDLPSGQIQGEKQEAPAPPPIPREALTKLLPENLPEQPQPPGIFLDFSDFPELYKWLQDTVDEPDIPLAIIGLLDARKNNLIEPVRSKAT